MLVVMVRIPIGSSRDAERLEERFRSRLDLAEGQPGFLGSTRYEVLDNPNILVEIADWASAEVRAAAMQEAMTAGAYTPLEALLAAPFRATVIRQLP